MTNTVRANSGVLSLTALLGFFALANLFPVILIPVLVILLPVLVILTAFPSLPLLLLAYITLAMNLAHDAYCARLSGITVGIYRERGIEAEIDRRATLLPVIRYPAIF